MQDLSKVHDADNLTTMLPVWIKDKVIPTYTVASVNYFQSLPGLQCYTLQLVCVLQLVSWTFSVLPVTVQEW